MLTLQDHKVAKIMKFSGNIISWYIKLETTVDTAMKVVLQSIEGDIPLYFLLPAVASKNFIVDKDIGKVKTL